MELAAKIRQARTTLSERRTVRLAQKRLGDELAAFASASDRAELEQILERYPSDQTREIRQILGQQDAQRQVAATVLGGRRI
jgi:hypothetical protein